MWFFRKKEERAEKQVVEVVENQLQLGSLFFGTNSMTIEKAMNIPSFKACVNKIESTVSILPIKLYKIEDDRKIEMKQDSRVFLLNKDTGDTLTGTQFKKAMIRDYLLGKGGYAYINKIGNELESIHYVDERQVTFLYNTDPIFKKYNIVIQGVQYEPHNFIKILKNTQSGWSGLEIVKENSLMLNVAYNTLIFENYKIKSGGNRKGFLQAEHKLEETAMKKLKEAWARLNRSEENVIVLQKGVTFKESTETSNELQMNENKRTNAEEICKLFNMPPRIITGGATEQDEKEFIDNCIIPIIEEFACALNRDLLLEKEKNDYFFAFDLTELTKGDVEKRYKAYEIACKSGFMQIDEIRFKENLPSLGLDFVRLGLQDVLYDTSSGEIFIPNMNAKTNINNSAVQNVSISDTKEKGENNAC